MSKSAFKNRILQKLAGDDIGQLIPFLEHVSIEPKQDLIVPGEPISHVWFPEGGLCALVAGTGSAESIEVAQIGFEGMTDHVLEPGDTSILRCVVQVSGSAQRVPAGAYAQWINNRPAALRVVTRYEQYMTTQLAYTALAHGSFTIEERLARWLVMCFDRVERREIPLVHDSIAMMLSVRRAGVTHAIHALEGHGAIRATRGLIHLRDREVLISLSGGSYGLPEREYERLMSTLG